MNILECVHFNYLHFDILSDAFLLSLLPYTSPSSNSPLSLPTDSSLASSSNNPVSSINHVHIHPCLHHPILLRDIFRGFASCITNAIQHHFCTESCDVCV